MISMMAVSSSYALTSTDFTDTTKLQDAGYSKETGRMAEQHTERANWETTNKEAPKSNIAVRFVKTVFGYFDPCADTRPFGAQTVKQPKAESL